MKKSTFIALISAFVLSAITISNAQTLNQTDDGFRGIWYYIGKLNNEYVHKYSGGLGTYPSNHNPFAVYSPTAKKTFFCFGGASKDAKPSLLHEISYFDHATGEVARPTIVLDKATDDAHDNPVLNIDAQGYIWVFSTSHGVERPSYLHRSRSPYSIDAFDKIDATYLKDGKEVPFNNFSYLQSYYQKGKGFFHLMTHYERGVLKYGAKKPRRTIGYITSQDGVKWSAIQDIGIIEEGHYQTSAQWKNKIGTSFNMHPDTEKGAGLDYRTNLYYVETTDFGKTWHNAQGEKINLPLSTPQNGGLVKEYRSQNLNVYINDVAYTAKGNPIILYVTSKGPDPGPEQGPHTWHVAYWNGKAWEIQVVTTADHNYDMGSLYIENQNTWKIIGPTEAGPQPYGTGGNIAVWVSKNQGKSWVKERILTPNSAYNHSYVRRPQAFHPDFYAFWADGHARQASESSLYFANQKGEVFRLPRQMSENKAKPQKINP
ncbi:BNR-4 repeat-containing protein [Runella zeae]|uniref:BNR-4 repeat-containing protein n=1 Tax=Runella zeae TaxID=94255 RepID=UPI0003F98DA9|nr:BNR-4 repeat-containing protein [Runella zeae]